MLVSVLANPQSGCPRPVFLIISPIKSLSAFRFSLFAFRFPFFVLRSPLSAFRFSFSWNVKFARKLDLKKHVKNTPENRR